MPVPTPRPQEGWRRFIGEIVIIVIGVLIALGADQLVEDVRKRQAADEARHAIRGELETNMARLRSRSTIAGCIERRIAEVQGLLDAAVAGDPFKAPTWVGRPQYWTMLTARWNAFTQSGQTALLPADELADYSQMYSWMENLTAEMQAEQVDWATLRTLEQLPRLSPQMAFDLGKALSDARYRRWRINLHTRQLAAPVERLGLRQVRNELPAPTGICVAMDTPREQAIREGGSAYGEP